MFILQRFLSNWHKCMKTSTPQTSSTQYTVSNVWNDWCDRPYVKMRVTMKMKVMRNVLKFKMHPVTQIPSKFWLIDYSSDGHRYIAIRVHSSMFWAFESTSLIYLLQILAFMCTKWVEHSDLRILLTEGIGIVRVWILKRSYHNYRYHIWWRKHRNEWQNSWKVGFFFPW